MSDLIYAPPPFVNGAGQKVRFVDFTHARYRLEFDAEAHEATACSEITFEADKQGLVAISLNQPYTAAALDGLEVTLDQESPDIGNLPLCSPKNHLSGFCQSLSHQAPTCLP